MGVSSPPYDVRTWIYPGANPAADPALWGLPVDVSTYVRQPGNDGGQPITWTYGRQNEAGSVDSATMNLSLNNRDGRFSTKNVTGPYYGLLSRNTPITVGTVSGYDSFTRTTTAPAVGTSDSGQSWVNGTSYSTNGTSLVATLASANSVSLAAMTDSGAADYDLFFTVKPSAVTTGATYAGSGLQKVNANDYLRYSVMFNPAGVVQAQIVRSSTTYGSTSSSITTLGFTYSAAQVMSVRCQRFGSAVRMKVWRTATDTEPVAWTVSWTEGALPAGDLGVLTYRFASNTDASFVMAYDDIAMIGIEYVGTVAQWPARWDMTGNNSWVPIQAAGILRRLQQGTGPLQSPLARQLPAYGPTGYWSLEDSSGATSFGSAVAGQLAATYGSVQPAGDSSLPGGGPAPTIQATNGHIYAATTLDRAYYAGANGFSAMFLTKFAAGLTSTKTAFATIYMKNEARAVRVVLSISTANSYVDVYDGNDSVISTATNSLPGTVSLTGWIAWQFETALVGTTTTWASIYHQVGQPTYYSQTSTYSDVVISTVRSIVLGNSNLPVGTAFAQIWMGPNTLPFVTDTFSLVSNGYIGELAADRITRLCFERGLPVKVESGTSAALGVQPQSTFLAAVQEAADADYGILYESGNGLGYRPRIARYDQPVWLSILMSAGQLATQPEPIDDDQRYRNYWTINRLNGSFAVATESPAVIALNGLYDDSATVNVQADTDLPDYAGWLLHSTSWPEQRLPALALDMSRNPALVPYWRKRGFSPRVNVTTGLVQLAGAEPDVLAEGWSVSLSKFTWTAIMNCSPAKIWDTSMYDSALAYYDSSSTTVASAVTSSATSLPITTALGSEVWETATLPYDVLVNGERMTVTACTAAAGTGPYTQTMTVTRSVNGAIRAHAVGEEVHVYLYAIYAR